MTYFNQYNIESIDISMSLLQYYVLVGSTSTSITKTNTSDIKLQLNIFMRGKR